MKIKIIGGGWYGCHLASSLLADDHDVTLFEKTGSLFSGASGANQSRTHLGFHYPRCKKTRNESRAGHREFMEKYGELTKEIPCNIYAIASDVSLIDFKTYRDIMAASGNDFLTLAPGDHGLTNIEGAVVTGERLILQIHTKRMFERLLAGHIIYSTYEDMSEYGSSAKEGVDRTYDLVLNCTYGALPTPGVARYEPCVLYIYEGRQEYACTVMDGPFGVSMYPYFEDGYVSLTSVEHTPIAICDSFQEAQSAVAEAEAYTGWLDKNRNAMEDRMAHYLPWFRDNYRYRSHSIAIRSLPGSAADRRTCHCYRDGNVVSVLPGKISGIFKIEREIKEIIDDCG